MSLHSLFEDEKASGPFALLTVCTGNICRSPLAEVLFRKVLHGLPVTVHSAGTQALVGHGMTEQNCIIAEEFGVQDVATHRARQLEKDFLSDADLVLTLTREHRALAVEMLPRASRRVFTLREFARIAEQADLADLAEMTEAVVLDPAHATQVGDIEARIAGRMRDAVELVAQLRGMVIPPENPGDDDVVDPFRQSDEVYARSAQQIVPAINATVRLLRGAAKTALT